MVTSERHQKSLLGGIERFVGVDNPQLIPSIPAILMAYYQADVLEEEVIKQWGTHVSKKYVDKETSKKVRKASAPFLEVSKNNCVVFSPFITSFLSSGLRKPMMTIAMRTTTTTTNEPMLPADLCWNFSCAS